MRTYITPSLLHHFDPNTPDQCIKCNVERGTLFHCLWKCPEIMKFWKEVLGILSQIISEDIPICPQLCILGIFPDNFKVNSKKKSMIIYSLLFRRNIHIFWKNPDRPDTNNGTENYQAVLHWRNWLLLLKGNLLSFKKYGDSSYTLWEAILWDLYWMILLLCSVCGRNYDFLFLFFVFLLWYYCVHCVYVCVHVDYVFCVVCLLYCLIAIGRFILTSSICLIFEKCQ